MIWPPSTYGGAWSSKILGTYELELTDPLQRLIEDEVEAAVVVGAAEGYYAVGLACREAVKHVVAFEPSSAARSLMTDIARRNGVESKLSINAICDVGQLRASLAGSKKALLIMDIEGGEAILLDPSAIAELRTTAIIVELHEFAVPGVTDLVRHRFETTHNVQEIFARPRVITDFPLPLQGWYKLLTQRAVIQAMEEHRPTKMSWLVMTPREE